MLEDLTVSLKKAGAALEEAGIPYLLAGGLGCWARGGPPSQKDIDLVLKPDDAEHALAALKGAGMRPERPPEQWLFKAWDDDILIDLIFGPIGLEVSDEVMERGEELNVAGMVIPVMALEDILVTKLLAIDEHTADYGGMLRIARMLREQIDWKSLRERTADSPFARAFFTLAVGLGISAESGPPAPASAARPSRTTAA
jgi:hypothetical protein